MKALENIENKINQLSPAKLGELEHYLDYLISKNMVGKPKKLNLNWIGGIKDIKLSSIELQKKALDWRQK